MTTLSVLDPTWCWGLALVMAFAVSSSAAHFGDYLRYRAEDRLRPPAGSIVPNRKGQR